ncbi:DinB family protein [Kribbella sp. NBC_00382]|uniref:DinB family protein n=1 Tax=Kribbella sp. NBC_00382 TaxID=2975967 RepID=UPI002E1DA5E8
MTWIAPEVERPEGSLVAPEQELLAGYLNFYRTTLLYKCSGLTAEQLAARPSPPSNLSLLGLIRHLTKVERIWFRIHFASARPAPAAPAPSAAPAPAPASSAAPASASAPAFAEPAEPVFDPALGKDADFELIDASRAQAEYEALIDEWALSDKAAEGYSLDQQFTFRDEVSSLRMIYIHLIGEYARHCGHADFLREHLDGVTGA